MKKQIISLVMTAVTVMAMIAPAHGRIHILIDKEGNRKFPIAVPGFVSEGGGQAGGVASKVQTLLKKDLMIADMFEVLDDRSLPQKDTDVTEIEFKKWQALEVGALIKGVATKDGLQLRLYDVGAEKMILGKQYSMNGKNYQDATHRFVDAAMEALTGTKGPFHSKIAAACGRAPKRALAQFEMDSERKGGLPQGGKNAISPAWSPDGKTVAYSAWSPEPVMEIFVGNRKVTSFDSTTVTPQWTPDGNLVVSSHYKGDQELYLLSRSGKMIRRLTSSRNIDVNPSVSPSGEVAYASERSGGLQIFAQPLSGGGARQLTYTGFQNDQPDWSPDGTKITFIGRDQGAFDVFTMDADGSNIRRVTKGQGDHSGPTWAPDSRYLAFYSTRGGIYVVLEDGIQETLIEKSQGCDTVDWGPWIAE